MAEPDPASESDSRAASEIEAAVDPGAQDARGTFVAHPAPPVPVVRRRGRRVTTLPAPGSDPTPAPVDRRVDSHDNDQRLQQDVPPHWG